MHDANPSSRLSIIVPTLNEASCIGTLLDDLAPLRAAGHELILVDGGSDDDTVRLASHHVDHVLDSPAGRARQMNTGAAAANGDVLWFVHADSRIPEGAGDALLEALRCGADWGRFDVRLSGRDWRLRMIERMMNLRSCITGIATGDQGMFISRSLFESCGGFPAIALMEDIALSRRLRSSSRPACIPKPRLVTSSRRWESRGPLRTVWLMWRLRLAYALGTAPDTLARRYR